MYYVSLTSLKINFFGGKWLSFLEKISDAAWKGP
jgi:hypothetical protein